MAKVKLGLQKLTPDQNIDQAKHHQNGDDTLISSGELLGDQWVMR